MLSRLVVFDPVRVDRVLFGVVRVPVGVGRVVVILVRVNFGVERDQGGVGRVVEVKGRVGVVRDLGVVGTVLV